MAEKLTKNEILLFDDISANVEQYDPGVEEFNFIVKRAELFINDNGGAESLNYYPTLAQLNDQWEFRDHTAKVSGKVYVLQDGIIDATTGEWNGPFVDERGTYYRVDGVTLVSTGILDARFSSPNKVSAEGDVDQTVELAYGFNPEDVETEMPMFYAGPDDILHAEYDMLSMDAVAMRLRRLIPDEMETLDKRIYKSGFDPMKLVKKLQKSISELQPRLAKNKDLQEYLARYIYERIELDTASSYGLTIEGPAMYGEDNDPLAPIVFEGPSLHYLRVAGVLFEEKVVDSKRHVKFSLICHVPTAATEKEGVEGVLYVPLESIKGMFSTRPMGSIHQSYITAVDERARLAYTGDAEISLPEEQAERPLHPKLAEYKRLEALESLINTMKRKTAEVRRTRHSTSQDALYVASNLAKWFHEEVTALNLQESDSIRVSGPGVVKANANLRTNQRSLHIEVDEENAIISPSITDDIEGVYDGVLAEVDKYENDDGTEFWQPAPKMTMVLKVIQTPLVSNNYPLLSAAVKSAATVRMDAMTHIELPELDRMRGRHQALLALAMEQSASDGLKHIRAIDRAFYHESPDTWNEAGPLLKHIRQLSLELTEKPEEALLEAFRQQLLGRRIQIAGNTWFGNGRSDDHMNVGIVNDMFLADLPDNSKELVINVASTTAGSTGPDADTAALVILRTVSLLKF